MVSESEWCRKKETWNAGRVPENDAWNRRMVTGMRLQKVNPTEVKTTDFKNDCNPSTCISSVTCMKTESFEVFPP